jgi:phosphoenolpyruvate synthase/pyruvate phosphate dikinase
MAKRIYYFGKTRTDGRGIGKDILGGKGANLAEMTSIGLPVPPGLHDHHRDLRRVLQAAKSFRTA